jgi:hypothetical protein
MPDVFSARSSEHAEHLPLEVASRPRQVSLALQRAPKIRLIFINILLYRIAATLLAKTIQYYTSMFARSSQLNHAHRLKSEPKGRPIECDRQFASHRRLSGRHSARSAVLFLAFEAIAKNYDRLIPNSYAAVLVAWLIRRSRESGNPGIPAERWTEFLLPQE